MAELRPIADLLKDIEGPSPVGESLRYTQLYEDIKQAQRADDDLPQGVWVQDLKVSDWHQVQTLCEEALIEKSKDLQICAWLMESWIFLHNMQGIEQGLALVQEMSQKYWEKAYPQIEEDGDLGFRLSVYIWMNEKLSDRLKFTHITGPEDTQSYPMTFAQYIEAKPYWGLDSSINTTVPEDKVALVSAFEASVSKTETTFFETLKTQCSESIDMTQNLEAFLMEKCDDAETPTLSRFRGVLEDIKGFCDQALGWKGAILELEEETPEEENTAQTAPPIKATSSSDAIDSREEAYALIRKAADYLDRTEPQSPAAPMLRRAIALGTLPLKNLLEEVIKDPKALEDVKSLLGLNLTGDAAPGTPEGLPQSWMDPAIKHD